MCVLRWSTAFLAMTMAVASPVAAGPIDQLNKAEELLQSGDASKAFELIDGIVSDFWQRSPMFMRKAFYASDVQGFGDYQEKDPVFKTNEPQIVYLEPVAFAFGKAEDGSRQAGWSVDFTLSNASGATLFSQEGFFTPVVRVGERNRNVHLKLTVNLADLRPGQYVSHYRLNDMHSDKSAEVALPFEVVE